MSKFVTSATESEGRRSRRCDTLTQHSEVEAAARLTRLVVGHAGVEPGVVEPGRAELHGAVEVHQLEVWLWIQSLPVLEPGQGRGGRAVGRTQQQGRVSSDHRHVLAAPGAVQTRRHWMGNSCFIIIGAAEA